MLRMRLFEHDSMREKASASEKQPKPKSEKMREEVRKHMINGHGKIGVENEPY